MQRLDKFISSQTNYSRNDVKKLVKNNFVFINGNIAEKSDIKIDEEKDIIKINNEEIKYQKYVYLMLNKPKGYVSAREDKNDKTVLELVPEKYLNRNLFPAGRLDKDTTGLMLITDDGLFAHNILSPSKHIKKKYLVTIDMPLTEDMVYGFKNGIKLIDGMCKPADLEIIDEYNAIVTLIEGKYHQIKRMFGCYNAKVLELKRITMGNFELPSNLETGKVREFTKEELFLLEEREDICEN